MELEDYIPQVEEFYRLKHNGRKLQWHHLMSNGIVRTVKHLNFAQFLIFRALPPKMCKPNTNHYVQLYVHSSVCPYLAVMLVQKVFNLETSYSTSLTKEDKERNLLNPDVGL